MALRRRSPSAPRPADPADPPAGTTPGGLGLSVPDGWFDPTYGWPELPGLVDHLVRTGDPEPLQCSLVALPDADARALYTWAAAPYASAGPGLDRWVEVDGGSSSLPWIVRAARHVVDAWSARWAATAAVTEADGWDASFAHLRAAESDLRTAGEVEPTDPVPWSLLVLTGRELRIPMEEMVARYERIDRLGVQLGQADDHLLRGLGAAWAGSSNHQLAFARRVHDQAPDGSYRHRLLAAAHHEHATSLDEATRARYWNDPTARNDITRAVARSADQPGFGTTWQDFLTLNELARDAWVFGLEDLERRCHQQIGARYTPEPWLAYDRPVETVRGRRIALGLDPT